MGCGQWLCAWRAEDGAEASPKDEEAEAGAETEEDLQKSEARNEADYRKIYMTMFAQEPRDYRLKAAMEETGPELLALCFDPEPQVIHALLVNPHAGLNHARMVAFHCGTTSGSAESAT
jgi:hypothetical protein